MDEQKDKNGIKQLVIGTLLGLAISLVGLFVQNIFDKEGRQDQLYIDEKKDFVLACDDYLKQYSQWHDLMEYCVYKDSLKFDSLATILTEREFKGAYKKWKKDLDFAYSKIFLLSNNEFGLTTMQASTKLNNYLNVLLNNKSSFIEKKKIQYQADSVFFHDWLQVAQEEIFKYNSNERDQKSLTQYKNEQELLIKKNAENDSASLKMYESLSKADEYLRRQDSLKGISRKRRLPTEKEFKSNLEELKN